MAAAIPGTREHWITPQQQLKWLLEPIEKDVMDVALPVFDVASTVLEYVSGNLTNWYTALKRLDILPETIPPLPLNIHEILARRCPIHGDKINLETANYCTVNDTHSLYLIPAGTVNELEARVSAYGKAHLAEYRGNPFQFSIPLRGIYPWFDTYCDHGSSLVWVLGSKNVLEESRDQDYLVQVQIIEELSERADSLYKIPSLKEAVAFAFLHQVVGESILQGVNPDETLFLNEALEKKRSFGGYLNSFTSVKRNGDFNFKIGRYSSRGLIVSYGIGHPALPDNSPSIDIGVLPVRKL